MKIHSLSKYFVATLVLAVAASAQQVVSYNSPLLAPLLTATPASVTQAVQLPGFDFNLGTLTEVKVSFNGFVQQRARGEFLNNSGAGTSNYSYNLTASVSVDRSGGPDLLDFGPVDLVGSGARQSLYDGTFDFAGASGFDTALIDTPLSADYFAPGNLLASYISLLPLNFSVTAIGNSSVSGPGNFAVSTTNLVGGMMEVMYTYTPIPEPSTYAALAGAAALGFVVRRRRRITD